MTQTCAILLLAAVTQWSCTSPPRTAARAVASEDVAPFDGAYALAAARCGIENDTTQVKADMFALTTAQKSGRREIETGHSRMTTAPGVSLTIAARRFTYVTAGQCAVRTSGEVEARGDDAILNRTAGQSCAGEVTTLDVPAANISRVKFEGEYLVESTAMNCIDGRTLQRIWIPARGL